MIRRDHIDKKDDPAAAEQRMIDYAPMKRIATPAEISQGVLYLASFAARFVTGAALPIDGGSTAGH
jgi:NAD(P)-dependent dehydrogenase (short-subunit alcohol dehydrogenase family)